MNERNFIGITELALCLDVKKSTIYAWVNQKKLPYYKIGRLVKFAKAEIEIWISKHKVNEFKAS